jgi:hypothetical protein
MKRLFIFTVAASSCFGSAAPTYLGLYLQGHKIGYSSFVAVPANWHGQKAERSDSRTVMDMGLLGTPLHMQIDSQTFTSAGQGVLEMKFDMESEGRKQLLDAEFSDKEVKLAIDNSGNKSIRVLPRPKGAIVDDPIQLVLKGDKKATCYVLDPTTASFVLNQVHLVGSKTIKKNGKSVEVKIVQIDDPRASEKVYVSGKGDVVRAEGPMGIVMLPESAREAMSVPAKYSPDVDLAYSSCIVPTGRLDDPVHAKSLEIQLRGANLSNIPSEEGQVVAHSPSGWTIEVQPHQIGDGSSIVEAAVEKPQFVTPDLDMPSNHSEFKSLAKKIIGSENQVEPASLLIKGWVYEHMRPNAGIGVLRDAAEVLKSKEGVCRDYAILTGTLLRAAGIPARLASGLVDWDGTFYYHAWNEIWNGHHWEGIDSTTPDQDFSATHIKLAEGTVSQTFTFAVLDGVKIHILSSHG